MLPFLAHRLKEQGTDPPLRAAAEDAKNRGNALLAGGDLAGARACYEEALRLRPAYPEACNNLGAVLRRQGRFAEAEEMLRRALSLRPELVEALVNLGHLRWEQERPDEAEAFYRRAVAIRPDHFDACLGLADLVLSQNHYDEASAYFRRALELRPDDANALAMAVHVARYGCDWKTLAADERRLRERLGQGDFPLAPFPLLSIDAVTSADLKGAGFHCGSRYCVAPIGAPRPAGAVERDRLRVGYLSADFHEHATTYLLAGVLEAHDARRMDVRAYSYGPADDSAARRRVMRAAAGFRDLRQLTDEAAAKAIAEDGVDILVDLKGHTHGARLGITALRPAPVIVSWLGYPGTLGHPRLADYIIGDPIVTPPECAGDYSETLALMPHCYQPNDRQRTIAPRPGRREAGLPDSGFVFCSFNQAYKIGPQLFDVWCRLLRAVPGSVLWLLAGSAAATARLRQEAAARDVAPARLVFAPFKPAAEHLGRLQLADLALDTFPCNSHTTASDALWAGVPLLTRSGETFAGRVAASLLHAVGLPELVVEDWDAYFELGRSMAADAGRLASIRTKLGNNKQVAPLYDTPRFARDLEELYRRIWSHHCRGLGTPLLPAAAPSERAAP